MRSLAAQYFGHMKIESVRPSHVAKYLQHRVNEGHGPVGNRDIAILASAYDFAQRQGWVDAKPTYGVKRNHEKPLRDEIEHGQLQNLIDTLSPHIANFVACLYLTGFRMGDLFQLKWSQLEKEGIFSRITLTSRARTIRLNWPGVCAYE